MPADTLATPPAVPVPERHPPGLRTLFFTEMWERCSYYGMRAILILFLIDSVRGLGMSTKMAAAVYGLYVSSVYLVALPGGWIADRFLGAQKAVWYGGILIAIGDFTLAVPGTRTFYLGLLFIVMGTGLLKPNVSAIVGGLYPEGGGRRDAGFSIFYMGINLGAFIGPFICSSIAEKINWRYGFAAPGIGMLFGLMQYRLNIATLGESGKYPGHREGAHSKDWTMLALLLGSIALVTGLAMTGVLKIQPITVAHSMAIIIAGIAFLYFAQYFVISLIGLLFLKKDARETVTEMKRVVVIIVLFISSAMFWSGFEQAGSSFNLFAKRYTLRTGGFDFDSFATNDITNLPLLAAKLTAHDEPVAAYIWSKCDVVKIMEVSGKTTTNNLQQILQDYVRQTNFDAATTEHVLVPQLDKLLEADRPLSDDASFTNVSLSPATRTLLSEHEELKKDNRELSEEKLARLNRLLLEDAFPAALSQNQTRQPSFTIPAGWFQAIGPLFVIGMSPVFAALWIYLTKRNRNPSLPAKFGLGLIILGLGFVVLAVAAKYVAAGHKVGLFWLTAVFFIHTVAELCVSPVGLSSVTKLAPKRMVGQMMGIWFLATSLGNLIAGLIAGGFDPEDADQLPALLMQIVFTTVGTGLLVLIFSKPIKKLMVGAE
jgi:amino acid/peptide:H+ symporter